MLAQTDPNEVTLKSPENMNVVFMLVKLIKATELQEITF